MNPDERDDELMREYLAGDSALSRLYRRGAREQPTAELDARILGEARRAVARKGRVVHSPFARHWMVPASLAAVLVLSVSVVVLLPDPEESAVQSEQAASTAVPGTRVGDAPGGAADAEQERLPAPLAAPGEADLRDQQRRRVEDGAAVGRASPAAPPVPPAGRQQADEVRAKSGEQRKVEALERRDAGGGESPTAPAAAGAAGVASEAMAPAASAPARAPVPLPAQSVRDDPQAWLRFMAALLDAGNQTGALSNLRAFRDRYPDFPLPERLAGLAATLDAQPP